jgi:hypothetical protein
MYSTKNLIFVRVSIIKSSWLEGNKNWLRSDLENLIMPYSIFSQILSAKSNKKLTNMHAFILLQTLKRQSHEIFDPRFFSLNCTPGSPESWAKTVLHIDSNSRRYSTTKIDSALCGIARSRQENFWLEFHIEWHSAESQIKLFLNRDSALCRIARSFFA